MVCTYSGVEVIEYDQFVLTLVSMLSDSEDRHIILLAVFWVGHRGGIGADNRCLLLNNTANNEDVYSALSPTTAGAHAQRAYKKIRSNNKAPKIKRRTHTQKHP